MAKLLPVFGRAGDKAPMLPAASIQLAAAVPAAPSAMHLLGTDPLGRDVLSQLMWSTRSEFILGIVAALVTVIFATTIGAVSA